MAPVEIIRAPRLPLAVLLVSLAGHAVAALLGLPADQALREGCLLLLAVSAGLDVAAHVVKRVGPYRGIHAVRFLCILVVVLLVGRAGFASTVVLSGPYLVETALFDDNRVVAFWNGTIVTAFAGAVAIPGLLRGEWLSLPPAAAFLCAGALVAGAAQVAVTHREENVRLSEEVRVLSTTVNNLVDANMAFQLYAHNIESESAENERNRITRELHDMIGYALTNVIVMMDAAPLLLRDEPQTLGGYFQQIRSQAEAALGDTRRILRRLREFRPFEPMGLQALAHLTRGFQGATGIEVRLNLGNMPWSLGRELDAALFRLVQESLTNAFRHGKATRVRINLWLARDAIVASVADNGRGTPSDATVVEGIGISGMRERLSPFGGEITLQNLPGGFELLATIPYGTGGIGGADQGADR